MSSIIVTSHFDRPAGNEHWLQPLERLTERVESGLHGGRRFRRGTRHERRRALHVKRNEHVGQVLDIGAPGGSRRRTHRRSAPRARRPAESWPPGRRPGVAPPPAARALPRGGASIAMMSRRACSAMAWWIQVAASGITPGSVPQVGKAAHRRPSARTIRGREGSRSSRERLAAPPRAASSGCRQPSWPAAILTDAEPRGQRFGAEPGIGGEPRGVAGPDVLAETVGGEAS